MRTKWMAVAAVVTSTLLALPLAAAPQDRVEGTSSAAGAPAGDEVRRTIKVVVVDGDGENEKVLEGRVIRLEGEPGDGERVRFLHAGPGEGGLLRRIEGRGYLGLQLIDVTPELSAHLGGGDAAGLLVGRVEAGSPAERAGVRVGDLLTRVGGEPVSATWDVLRRVRPLTTGQGIALEVVRDGRVETLSATVEERDRPQVEARALLRRLGEDGETRVWEIDPAELGKRMGEVTELFASPEWRERVRTLTVTGEGLEQRLEAMERELERLAAHIEEQNRELEALEDDERE